MNGKREAAIEVRDIEQTTLSFVDGFAGKSLELDRELRRLGIEGENAFYALAFHYVGLSRSSDLKFSERFNQLGKSLIKKVHADRYLFLLLNSISESDPEGINLPAWYEYFHGRRFREGSGKFFTPQPVAAAAVQLLPKKEGAVIMDPSCGGGTFLIEASRLWGESSCTLIANDVEASLVDLTRLTLSLRTLSDHKKHFLQTNIYQPDEFLEEWYGHVDFIVANPPFSIKVSTIDIESGLFALGYRNSDALFLDVSLKLLRPGGRLVCLLPHSVIANAEFSQMRYEIEENWNLLGVIGLPEGVFHSTANTMTRADIVILEKRGSSNSNSETVFASTPSVGVPLNRREKNHEENHLLELLENIEIRRVFGLEKET